MTSVILTLSYAAFPSYPQAIFCFGFVYIYIYDFSGWKLDLNAIVIFSTFYYNLYTQVSELCRP